MQVPQCTQPLQKLHFGLSSSLFTIIHWGGWEQAGTGHPPCQRPSQIACLELGCLSSAFLRDKPSVWMLVLPLWWIPHTIGCSFPFRCKVPLSFHTQNSQFWHLEQANLWTLFLWQADFSTKDLSLSSQGITKRSTGYVSLLNAFGQNSSRYVFPCPKWHPKLNSCVAWMEGMHFNSKTAGKNGPPSPHTIFWSTNHVWRERCRSSRVPGRPASSVHRMSGRRVDYNNRDRMIRTWRDSRVTRGRHHRQMQLT